MAKIKKGSIFILIILLLFTGYSIFSREKIDAETNADKINDLNTLSVEGNYVNIDSADELFQEAELVIIAEPKEEFLDRVHKITYSNDNAIEDYYTETIVNVEEIIKAPADLKITKNNDFKIVEAAVGLIKDSKGNKVKIITDQYTEMKKGKKYLIFLIKNMYGDYSVAYNILGKYNIDNKDEEDINLNSIHEEHKIMNEKKEKFRREYERRFNLE